MSPVASRLRSAFPIGPGWLLLCVAYVVMGGLLVPALGAGALALDEHVSYWMLDSEYPGTVQSRCLEYGAVPPLGSWLQAASVQLFGKSEWALRLPSLVAAWLSLVVVFITARQLPPSNADDGTLGEESPHVFWPVIPMFWMKYVSGEAMDWCCWSPRWCCWRL